jgi:hypothetical protein
MSTTKRLDMPLRGNLVKHIFPIEMYFLVVHSWSLPFLPPCTMKLSIEFNILKNLRLSWIKGQVNLIICFHKVKSNMTKSWSLFLIHSITSQANFFYQGYNSCFHRDTIFNMVVVCVKRLFVIAFMIFKLDKFFNKI